MSYRYQTRVRYGECDQQKVVFNANYMAYMDDATEIWLTSGSTRDRYEELGWDYMLVKAAIEWQGSARTGDTLSIDVGIVRYGSASFDVGYVGTVEGQPVFTARAVCVSIKRHTTETYPTPDFIKAILGETVDWDVPA
jgi:acyl-CoA thioester hydrolase